MKKWLIFLVLSVAVTAYASDYEKWIDEEIKVLITKQEKDAFKKLKNDADKDQFIENFWAKRDPSPGTPENEFKKIYEDRLKDVNEKLKGSRKKPVDTDIGKTVLLLGNPTEFKTQESDPPEQTWSWRGLPPEMGIGDVDIKFKGDPEEGGYVFQDSKAANSILDKARNYLASLSTVASSQQAVAPSTPAPAAGVTHAALKAALDAAAAGNSSNEVPMQAITDSFMTSTGETFATIAVSSTADTSAAKAGVRILDSSGAVVKEVELPYAIPGEPAGYFQTSLPIEAGDHSAVVAVSSGDKTGATKLPLSVPGYGDQFSISSLILAKEFKQLTDAKLEKEPYTFGKIKVIPCMNHEFEKTDDLIIVYEAYNFQPDAEGKSNLEVVFMFQKDQDKPLSTAPAPPSGLVTGKKITIPTSYPLAKFPPGQYKLTITLTDKVSGQTARREASFTIKG